jgi:hypothetical protein
MAYSSVSKKRTALLELDAWQQTVAKDLAPTKGPAPDQNLSSALHSVGAALKSWTIRHPR